MTSNSTDDNDTDSLDADEEESTTNSTTDSADDDRALKDRVTPSRRIVIKTAAAIGVLSSVSSYSTAQEFAETFELEGETGGWHGVSPDEIEGDRNPTLEVIPGEEYELTWENTDGASHNFAIENEDGDVVFASEYISSIGETDTIEFTAEEDFQTYLCEPHPDTMTGDFEIIDPDAEDDDEEEDEVEDEELEDEEDETPEEEPAVVFRLALEESQWRGLSPEEIEGETNPTLELEAGEPYAIAWILRTERNRHETGHNLVIHDEDGSHRTYTRFLRYEGMGITHRFTADEEMAYYADQTQLDAQGEIEVLDGEGTDDEDEDEESTDD